MPCNNCTLPDGRLSLFGAPSSPCGPAQEAQGHPAQLSCPGSPRPPLCATPAPAHLPRGPAISLATHARLETAPLQTSSKIRLLWSFINRLLCGPQPASTSDAVLLAFATPALPWSICVWCPCHPAQWSPSIWSAGPVEALRQLLSQPRPDFRLARTSPLLKWMVSALFLFPSAWFRRTTTSWPRPAVPT